MTDNLELWNKVRTPDPRYTKKFTRAGGFSGTSISPMALIQMATAEWGKMGDKWGARELATRIENGVWFSKVQVWFPGSSETCGLVEQWGGTPFQVARKDGTVAYDDEAAKKSYTDALSKCLSWLGFGADVHMGMFDDVKYVNDARARFEAEESKVAKPAKEPIDETKQPEVHHSFKNAAERNRMAKELLAGIEATDDPDYYYNVERADDFARTINGSFESQVMVDRAIKKQKEFLAHKQLQEAGMKH